jgi:23S rRNA pseudouridine2605 synthase
MGYKVQPGDLVNYGGQTLKPERHVYVLLNKPKDFITTRSDPQDRRTVMNLIAKATKENIYPVGRLDRMTTGLLLFTNDGELTRKLTHPSSEIEKIYHVFTDKVVKYDDLKKLQEGIELEDGMIKADKAKYVGNGEDKKQVGVELHSGRNRIVRRMFEHLGYRVIKLDRVVFAGLTKKDLPRGKYRLLSEREIATLKML